MNLSTTTWWMSIGGPAEAPKDVMGNLTRQRIVKDEVAFQAGRDPVKDILLASTELLSRKVGDFHSDQLQTRPEDGRLVPQD